MGEEHRHLVGDRPARRGSLRPGCREAHDDVAEQSGFRAIALGHRECQDVGCLVFLSIDAIELAHLNVVCEKH